MNRRIPFASRLHITMLLLPAFLLNACSLIEGRDNREPPAELEPIQAGVPIERIWSAEVGDSDADQSLDLRPAFSQGRIYAAGSDGAVTALDANTGQTIWRIELDDDARIVGGVGVGEGRVVVSTADGDLIALDPNDGGERWRVNLGSQVLAPVALAEGRAVARTSDGRVRGLSAADGAEHWMLERRLPALTLRGASKPLIQAGKAILGMDNGRLVVVDLDRGRPVWERTVATPSGRSELERMTDIDADPLAYRDKIYVTAFQGRLMEINFNDGSVNWARPISSHTGLDADPRRLAVTDDEGNLWILERLSGEPLLKQNALRGRSPTAPKRAGNYLVVGDFEGYVHWFSLETGETAGRIRVDDSGIRAAPLVVGDVVYVLSRDGVLSALRNE